MFYLDEAFIMVPKSVMIFALTVRTANAGRVYLYLYSNSLGHSWKYGTAKKYSSIISYRQISKRLQISYGVVEDSIHTLLDLGAVEKTEETPKGTIYKINVPEWYDEETDKWHFVDVEKSRVFYNMSNEYIDTLKHLKTKIKQQKIPLFKKIFD